MPTAVAHTTSLARGMLWHLLFLNTAMVIYTTPAHSWHSPLPPPPPPLPSATPKHAATVVDGHFEASGPARIYSYLLPAKPATGLLAWNRYEWVANVLVEHCSRNCPI